MNLDLTLDWSTVTSITLPLLIGVAYFVRVGALREQGRQPSDPAPDQLRLRACADRPRHGRTDRLAG